MDLWKRQVEVARRARDQAAKKKLEWEAKEAELTPEQKRARDRIAEYKQKQAATKAAELQAEEEEEARRLAALDEFSHRPGMQRAILVKQQQLEDVASSSDSSTTVASSDEELEVAAAAAVVQNLDTLTSCALKKRAAACGVDTDKIDEEDNADDVKAVLIGLIVENMGLQYPESEPELEAETELEPEVESDETQHMLLTAETELVNTVKEEEATSSAREHEPCRLQISTTESVHEDEDHAVKDEEGKQCRSRSTMDFDPVPVTPLLDSLTAMLPTEDSAEEVAEELSDASSSTDEHQCSPTQAAETDVAEVVPEMVVEHPEEEDLHLGPTVHQMMYPLGGPLDTPPSIEEQSGQEGCSVTAAAELSTGDPQAHSTPVGNGVEVVPDELHGVNENVDEGMGESATVTRKVRLGM